MNSSKDIFINRVAFSFITNIKICFIFGRALSFGTRLCFFWMPCSWHCYPYACNTIRNTAFIFPWDYGRLEKSGQTPVVGIPATLPMEQGHFSLRLSRHRHHAHPHTTASRPAAVTHTVFGWSAHAVMASERKVPVHSFSATWTIRHVRHLHTFKGKKMPYKP